MIIKIEGLPEGHKIAHINVDIRFEGDGEVNVETHHVLDTKNVQKVNSKLLYPERSELAERSNNSFPDKSIDTSKTTGIEKMIPATSVNLPVERKVIVPIPDEMKDVEF